MDGLLRAKLQPRLKAAAGGAAGGAAGVLAGHLGVEAARSLVPGAPLWLKGAHGPPFFELALYSSLFYAGAGAGIPRGEARLQAAGRGAGAFFFCFCLPMAAATRLFSWGESAAEPQTLRWFYLVLGSYGAANVAAALALGRAGSRARPWRAALGALAGLSAACALQTAWSLLRPGGPAREPGLAPTLQTLGVSALWGLCLGFGAGREVD